MRIDKMAAAADTEPEHPAVADAVAVLRAASEAALVDTDLAVAVVPAVLRWAADALPAYARTPVAARARLLELAEEVERHHGVAQEIAPAAESVSRSDLAGVGAPLSNREVAVDLRDVDPIEVAARSVLASRAEEPVRSWELARTIAAGEDARYVEALLAEHARRIREGAPL